jgi:hypothetical protein
MSDKTYLGDGLYAEDVGHQIELSCERDNGTNWVALDPSVMTEFFLFIERVRHVKIEVKNERA